MVRPRVRVSLFLSLLCGGGWVVAGVAPVMAQENTELPEVGGFSLRYPEAYDLLNRTEESYTRLIALIVDETQPPPTSDALEEGDVLAQLNDIAQRVHQLRIQILDLYSDTGIPERAHAVEEAIDLYLADSARALPALPKSMDVLHDHPLSGSLESVAQDLLRENHAGGWLQLALFEPILLRADEGEGRVRDGVDMVRSRFLEKFESSPMGLPSELPMAPTIAPDLTSRHPRAAAIFDNLSLLRMLVAELLAGGVEPTDPALSDSLNFFLDPSTGITTDYQWVLMALRHGIYHQGGPALGTLEGNERNEGGGHGGHEGHPVIMPGMGGMN